MIEEIDLDENAPEGLQNWYYSPTLDLAGLISHPEWIKWLKGKDEYVRAHLDIEYYEEWSTLARLYNSIPHEVDVYMSMLYEEELRKDVLNRGRIRNNALTNVFKKRNQDLFFDNLDLDVQALLNRDDSLQEKCEKLMPYKDVLRDKKVYLKFESKYDKFFEFCESIDVAFDLAIKYGGTCIKSIQNWSLDDEDKSLTKEEQFRKIIYKNIEKHNIGNHEFLPEDFKQEYPELFLTEEESLKMSGDSVFSAFDYENMFYCGMFDIKEIDEDVAEVLRTKNIRAAMRLDYNWIIDLCGGDVDEFIEVALEYGDLLNRSRLREFGGEYYYRNKSEIDENIDMIELMDDLIYQCIVTKDMSYDSSSIPERFQRKYPELFLLPEELEALREEERRRGKRREIDYGEAEIIENEFYKGQINFWRLSDDKKIGNKVLREIIKNKNLAKCMTVGSNAEEFISRFTELLGGDRDKAFNLACKGFALQLDNLLAGIDGRGNIEKILAYYKEMGFVPHHAVVRKFPKDRIRDFKLNSKLWGKLMQNPEYNKNSDTIGSLLEAAVVMGVFETREFIKNGQTMVQGAGQEGFEKLQKLLNYIPEFLFDKGPIFIGDTVGFEELGFAYAKMKPDYIDELIYQAIEREAKEQDIYDEFIQGDISRSDLWDLRNAFLWNDDLSGNIDECFECVGENKFRCIVERNMDSKIKVLFHTLGLKNDSVLSQDEFGMLKMADKNFIMKAFEETKEGFVFNMAEIDGRFVIGDNVDIDEEQSKRNKKLFDYIKFLMMEYGLEEEGARLAANNDRSKIDLVLNKNQITKIFNATERISLRAQRRYKKRVILKPKEGTVMSFIDSSALHNIFDGFNLTYNEEFRDFLIENIEDIVYDDVLCSKINAIQEKIISMSMDPDYAEVKITPEVVLRALNEFDYKDKKVGFEKGAELASKFAFNQEYFIESQEIWEEARKRESSSIPRVTGKEEKYSYEVLRLDDAIGIFAGNITDCCQKVGGVGESAMLHSMQEKSGRVFVVRDEGKKIIAQAWLWRNGNTICFDNVEMPRKSDSHENQTVVYDILKKVARELCDKDSEMVDRLLEEGKIEKEKADLLKAKKVTVGKGNTDIRAIRLNYDESIEDRENKQPVQDSDYYLYTSDSEEQVILYQAEDYISSDYSMDIHRDENEEKECKDITRLDIKTMEAIECEIDEEASLDYKEITNNADLAKMYAVEEDKLKLVMGTDWFMLYSENEEAIKVHKMLKSPSSGIIKKSIREQKEAVKMLMEKVQKGNKTISMEIENDRVYEATKMMIKHMKGDYEMSVSEEENERGHRFEISGVEAR